MKKNKKYKLLQVYPGLPKGWEVGMEFNIGEHTLNYSPCNSKYTKMNVAATEVEDNPNYFEEITEKEYEILSFKNFGKNSVYAGVIVNLSENGTYNTNSMDNNLTLEYCLNNDFEIIKVKRLSDSEIFSIGDNTNEGCISSFFIKQNYLLVLTNLRYYSRNLRDLEIVRRFLFKTFDGIDIFEGDSFYIHVIPFNDKNKINICKQIANSYYKDYCFKKEELTFSTKEAAENYVIRTKTCISLNDVLKFQKIQFNTADYTQIIDIEKLKEFIKTKI